MTLAGLWAILQSIPEALSLLRELLNLAKLIFGDDPKKFIRDSAQAFSDLKVAQTKEEKVDALRKVQDLIARL